MGDTPTEIILETRVDNVDWASAHRALQRWNGPKRTISYILPYLLVWGLVSVGLTFIMLSTEDFWVWGLVCVVAGFGLCMFDVWLRSRRLLAAMKSAPIFKGVTQVCLSATGCSVAHAGYDANYKWSHIPGVFRTDDAVLLVFGKAHFLPIQIDAFQSQQQMEQIMLQIEQWIEAGVETLDN